MSTDISGPGIPARPRTGRKARATTVILLVVGFLILGAGAGAVALLLRARRPAADSSPRVAVPSFVIEDNKDLLRTESEVEGHRDLRFQNQADQPVTVRLEATDCECARVLVCVAPEEWAGLTPSELHQRAGDSTLAWQTLAAEGEAFTVPTRAQGLLRLTWKTAAVGDHVFWARLGVDDGQDRGTRRVEVPVRLVALVRACAADDPRNTELDVGTLSAREERTGRLLFYSQTRDRFTLTPVPPDGDSCVLGGTPEPLTGKELQSLSEKVGTEARAGYRVNVRVRERVGDTRLDLGPFRHRLIWKTDLSPGHQVAVFVNGTVQGEVGLSDPEGRTVVDLGTILPTDPKSVIFTLQGRDPQLRLTVDAEKTLEFLRAELLDGAEGQASASGKSWRVRVQFHSASFFRGPFPNRDRRGYDSAVRCSVVFRISRPGSAGQPARRLFVPIQGTVRSY